MGRSLGRNDLPGFEVGIIDTFPGILPIAEDPVRQHMELPSIGFVRLPDGLLISGPEQVNDRRIIHIGHILSFCFLTHRVRKMQNQVTSIVALF